MKDLLKKLIGCAPTSENGELAAATTLQGYFEQFGIFTYLDCWDKNHANLIATVGRNLPDVPTLIFGVHLDVVGGSAASWQTEPFQAVEKNGKIYGRGACDMQGGICAAAEAIVEIARLGVTLNGRVIFAATAGEETDSCGAKRFIEQYRAKITHCIGILIPEPTGLEILRAHRGILWLKIQTYGKTAHGSMPHLGINAIEKMNVFLNRLKTYQIPHTPHELLGGCSMSVNRIAGGSATNIVPENCSIELDIRTLPGQNRDDIVAGAQAIFEDIKKDDPNFKADISIVRAADAIETDAEEPFVKTVCRATGIDKTGAAGFTTDGPYFKKLDAPVVIFGPGDGTLCHKPNEYIEIVQLEQAKEYYKKLISEILIVE